MAEKSNIIFYVPDERNNQFEILIDSIRSCGNFICEKKEISKNEDKTVFYTLNQSVISNHNGNQILNDIILERLKNDNNFKLIIYSAHESIDNIDFERLKNYIIKNQVEQKKIYLINNSSNMEHLQKTNSTNFNIYKLNVLSFIKINDMINSTESYFEKDKKGKFFMTFNKEDKKHRYGILIMLMKYSLINDTNWSLLPTNRCGINSAKLKCIFDDKTIKGITNEIEYFQKLNFKLSDFEDNYEYNLSNVLSLTMVESFENYRNSYINLTTESIFDERENVIHITEKSFKPFYYYQFPLILSSENHIKKMKELYNLDFYEDIINYSYDDVVDDKKRFEMYFEEVLRISNNRKLFIDFYNNNQDRFEINKLEILNIKDRIQNDYKYFSELT